MPHQPAVHPVAALGRESYQHQSRRPLASLAFVLPLVALYEVGTWRFAVDSVAHTERRIVAFVWLRELFARAGATGWLLPPLAVLVMLFGWHVFARHPLRLRPGVLSGMLLESLLLALPLLAALVLLTRVPLAFVAPDHATATLAVLGVGAGVYEEFVFRLIGFALLHALLSDLLGLRPGPTLVVTLLVTSPAFAAYHYLNGEPLDAAGFGFRAAAGLYLGVVFAKRGFGVAAGCHAAYDVLLVLLTLAPT